MCHRAHRALKAYGGFEGVFGRRHESFGGPRLRICMNLAYLYRKCFPDHLGCSNKRVQPIWSVSTRVQHNSQRRAHNRQTACEKH